MVLSKTEEGKVFALINSELEKKVEIYFRITLENLTLFFFLHLILLF
jgi:hypothetical protein